MPLGFYDAHPSCESQDRKSVPRCLYPGAVSVPLVVAASALLVALLGLVDHVTGPELGLSLFYLVPVGFAASRGGLPVGLSIAGLAAGTWGLADFTSGHVYSRPELLYWNAAIRAGIFSTHAFLVVRLRRELAKESRLARTDSLTGLLNSRGFVAAAQPALEQARARRVPVALLYLDLDDFKGVNDRWGHHVGSQAIEVGGHALAGAVRATDFAARLGGDEFAALLVGADESAARAVGERVWSAIGSAMAQNGWRVTASVGLAVFRAPAPDLQTMIRRADSLMYEAKNGGKNRISLAVEP